MNHIPYSEDIWDECSEALSSSIYTTRYSTFISCSPSNDVSDYDNFVRHIISEENKSSETAMALNPEEFEDKMRKKDFLDCTNRITLL